MARSSLATFHSAVQRLLDAGIPCSPLLVAPPVNYDSHGKPDLVRYPSWMREEFSRRNLNCSILYMDRPKSKRKVKANKKYAEGSEHPSTGAGAQRAARKGAAFDDGFIHPSVLASMSMAAAAAQKKSAGSGARPRHSSYDLRMRRLKEDPHMERWTPVEDAQILRLAERYYPNFVLVALVMNLKPPVLGRKRSGRQCQERYQELVKGRKPDTTNAPSASIKAQDAVTPRLISANRLMLASWPAHKSEEDMTPSVLPVTKIVDTEYQTRRQNFGVLLQCEGRMKQRAAPIPGTEVSAQQTIHPSHKETILQRQASAALGPLQIVQHILHPPPPPPAMGQPPTQGMATGMAHATASLPMTSTYSSSMPMASTYSSSMPVASTYSGSMPMTSAYSGSMPMTSTYSGSVPMTSTYSSSMPMTSTYSTTNTTALPGHQVPTSYAAAYNGQLRQTVSSVPVHGTVSSTTPLTAHSAIPHSTALPTHTAAYAQVCAFFCCFRSLNPLTTCAFFFLSSGLGALLSLQATTHGLHGHALHTPQGFVQQQQSYTGATTTGIGATPLLSSTNPLTSASV